MSKKKETKKDREEIDPRFANLAWKNNIKEILSMENASERNTILGQFHDAKEVREISYLMSLGQLLDMVEWCAEQGKGVDVPWEWVRIPIGRKKSLPLPVLSGIFALIFIIAAVNGIRIGPLLIIAMGFTITLVGIAITLGRYKYNKSGECHQCGIEIDESKETKVMNRNGEEVPHSDAGLCDPQTEDTNDCEWIHERHGMWDVNYTSRIDLIYIRKNRQRIGLWKDPCPGGNGAEYTWEDRKNPYDREDKALWDRIERRCTENKKDRRKLRKRSRKRRIKLTRGIGI